MIKSIIVRFETLCGCTKEEPFEFKDYIPEFIIRPIWEGISISEFRKDLQTSTRIRRRKFQFYEILRNEYNVIFVYKEAQDG